MLGFLLDTKDIAVSKKKTSLPLGHFDSIEEWYKHVIKYVIKKTKRNNVRKRKID